ncbi:MAG: neuraminidase-like domain-containing protein, partial [Bacteroidia bacterium]
LLGGEYNDVRKLSEFLLLDVSMNSDTEISLVKLGLNSAQLYLQRCRLHLERNVVVDEHDFHESWWEWIMNYRIWEANRKVFMYPENYLDPSLRHTKTGLFEDLESALGQGQVDKVLVEDSFTQYMNGFEKLATLEYVEAYNTVVTDADQQFDTLFLFARTKTTPREYYFITRKKPINSSSTAEIWSEWSKINAPINTDFITPIYAFNKLFVFWMEVKSNQERDQTSTHSDAKATVWKADLKFTYHNFSGDWVQPQDVFMDKVINVETEEQLTIPNQYLFDPKQAYWNKVRVDHQPINESNGTEEKIIIHYGPMLKTSNALFSNEKIVKKYTSSLSDAVTISKYKGAIYDFALQIHYAYHNQFGIQTNNSTSATSLSGYFPLYQSILLGSDLKATYLLAEEEFLFFRNDLTENSIQINLNQQIVTISATENTLHTNYEENSLTSLSQSETISAINAFRLNTTSIPFSAQIIPAKNNPGIFVVTLDSEAFLIENPNFSRIDESLNITHTAVGDTLQASDFPSGISSNTLLVNAFIEAAKNAFTDSEGHRLSTPHDKGSFSASMHFSHIAINRHSFSPMHDAAVKIHDANYTWETAYDVIHNAILNVGSVATKLTVMGYNNSKTPGNLSNLTFTTQRISTNAIDQLSKRVFVGGVEQLLDIDAQRAPSPSYKSFSRFSPDVKILPPTQPIGDQVSFEGPYGNYYWELFFHAPLLVSKTLKTNQQFLDAEKWLQYIFNPTEGKQKTDYWRYLPFQTRITETRDQEFQNTNAIAVYNDDPFDPHAIAQVRPGAYEKSIVMQYIDNRLEWGDNMFGRYTWESVTSASMLYMYAYDLLGNRPEKELPYFKPNALSFANILSTSENTSSAIPQFFVELENIIATRAENIISSNSSSTTPPSNAASKLMPFSNLEAYFHIPENEQFVAYWDRVEDRLYKIRNGMNLQGVRQPLALFEPPIDPLQLIQAAANGGNFLDVATQIQANVPLYRFALVLEKAKSFTQTVMQLGANLLAAIEKKDAEKLAALHTSQELSIQNMLLQIKQQQITEQEQSLDGLNINLQSAQNRFDHYDQLAYMNDYEIASMALMGTATTLQQVSNGVRALAFGPYLAPNIFGFADGGMKYGDAVNVGAQVIGEDGAILNQIASILNTKASYERRKEEWKLQKEIAQFEVDQINTQIEATKTRIEISKQELKVQQTTIKNAQEIDSFMKSKFTNVDLYQWMLGRLSTLYFETYKLASSTALMAQQAYNFELDTNENFITFDSWDSLHKGLLAGEGLLFSLQQMEKAYLTNNTRRFEIEKTISLRQQFPEEFLKFKSNGNDKGKINFHLKQSLFDFDFPNHYARKIKAISISIPAVVGPYQSINATLTQTNNIILLKPQTDAVSFLLDPTSTRPDNSTLRENWIPSQQIALSKGIDDMGLFTLNFNDERLLPFEGTGAVSSWTLKMPPERNRFNFDSISDVLVKVYYTALDGGEKFGADVVRLNQQKDQSTTYAKMINLKQAFPNAWNQLINSTATSRNITFKVTDDQVLPDLHVSLKGVLVQLKIADGVSAV